MQLAATPVATSALAAFPTCAPTHGRELARTWRYREPSCEHVLRFGSDFTCAPRSLGINIDWQRLLGRHSV